MNKLRDEKADKITYNHEQSAAFKIGWDALLAEVRSLIKHVAHVGVDLGPEGIVELRDQDIQKARDLLEKLK